MPSGCVLAGSQNEFCRPAGAGLDKRGGVLYHIGGVFYSKGVMVVGKAASVQARIDKAAAATGLGEAIAGIEFDLRFLETAGLLVDVDSSGFRMLTRQLSWEALGVELPADARVTFRAPAISTVPKETYRAFCRASEQARAALNHYGLRMTMVEVTLGTSEYRWIPEAAWPMFRAAFDLAVADLEKTRAGLLADYETARAQVIDTVSRMIEDSARRLAATTDGARIRPDFRERMVEQITAAIPTPEAIKGLSITFRPRVPRLTSETLAELTNTREGEAEVAHAEATIRAARETVASQARLEQIKVWQATEAARIALRAQQGELDAEAQAKAEIRALKLEAVRQQVQESVSPIQEGLAQLHAVLYKAADKVREALEKPDNEGQLPASCVASVRRLGKWYAAMSQFSAGGDKAAELVAKLETLALQPKGPARSAEALTEVLSQITAITRLDAERIAASGRGTGIEY